LDSSRGELGPEFVRALCRGVVGLSLWKMYGIDGAPAFHAGDVDSFWNGFSIRTPTVHDGDL
jgi:hypothetical protein